jgi:hypothetical protein
MHCSRIAAMRLLNGNYPETACPESWLGGQERIGIHLRHGTILSIDRIIFFCSTPVELIRLW